jgi:hypothetical protein
LGVSENIEDYAQKIKMYLGSLNILTRDEYGETPKIEQLPAQSMEPHIAHMRYLASLFAGETGLPLSSLGIVQDNPSSADAMKTAKDDLVVEATALNQSNAYCLNKVAKIAYALRENKGQRSIYELPKELNKLQPKFINPSLISPTARADTIVKLISAFPFLQDTNIALQEAGFTSEQIAEIRKEKQDAKTDSLIEKLAEMPVSNNNSTASTVETGVKTRKRKNKTKNTEMPII